MDKISPCLWFDGKAEEAARFYTSVFKKSKMGAITRYGETGPGKKGSVMTVTFEIEGHEFMGLNGGPEFKFSEAISFVVHCKTQKQVDRSKLQFSVVMHDEIVFIVHPTNPSVVYASGAAGSSPGSNGPKMASYSSLYLSYTMWATSR